MSYPSDGEPRYAVGAIRGPGIMPDGSGTKAGPAAYVYDRARCFAIVREYRGAGAIATAERTAARLERQMIGEPPKPIPAGSKMRHGSYSAYQNLGCRCFACAEFTRRMMREWSQAKADETRQSIEHAFR